MSAAEVKQPPRFLDESQKPIDGWTWPETLGYQEDIGGASASPKELESPEDDGNSEGEFLRDKSRRHSDVLPPRGYSTPVNPRQGTFLQDAYLDERGARVGMPTGSYTEPPRRFVDKPPGNHILVEHRARQDKPPPSNSAGRPLSSRQSPLRRPSPARQSPAESARGSYSKTSPARKSVPGRPQTAVRASSSGTPAPIAVPDQEQRLTHDAHEIRLMLRKKAEEWLQEVDDPTAIPGATGPASALALAHVAPAARPSQGPPAAASSHGPEAAFPQQSTAASTGPPAPAAIPAHAGDSTLADSGASAARLQQLQRLQSMDLDGFRSDLEVEEAMPMEHVGPGGGLSGPHDGSRHNSSLQGSHHHHHHHHPIQVGHGSSDYPEVGQGGHDSGGGGQSNLTSQQSNYKDTRGDPKTRQGKGNSDSLGGHDGVHFRDGVVGVVGGVGGGEGRSRALATVTTREFSTERGTQTHAKPLLSLQVTPPRSNPSITPQGGGEGRDTSRRISRIGQVSAQRPSAGATVSPRSRRGSLEQERASVATLAATPPDQTVRVFHRGDRGAVRQLDLGDEEAEAEAEAGRRLSSPAMLSYALIKLDVLEKELEVERRERLALEASLKALAAPLQQFLDLCSSDPANRARLASTPKNTLRRAMRRQQRVKSPGPSPGFKFS